MLASHRFPATVFAVSGYCGRRNDWPSQPRAGIPLLDLMDWGQLQEIARMGISVGAHTATHPRLSALPLQEAKREMADSRTEVEQRLGLPADSFAYPYGDTNPEVRRLAAALFQVSCSTTLDFAGPDSDSSDCPRLDMFYFRSVSRFARLLRGRSRFYVASRRGLRAARKLL